jgi:hypothetical protein
VPEQPRHARPQRANGAPAPDYRNLYAQFSAAILWSAAPKYVIEIHQAPA